MRLLQVPAGQQPRRGGETPGQAIRVQTRDGLPARVEWHGRVFSVESVEAIWCIEGRWWLDANRQGARAALLSRRSARSQRPNAVARHRAPGTKLARPEGGRLADGSPSRSLLVLVWRRGLLRPMPWRARRSNTTKARSRSPIARRSPVRFVMRRRAPNNGLHAVFRRDDHR